MFYLFRAQQTGTRLFGRSFQSESERCPTKLIDLCLAVPTKPTNQPATTNTLYTNVDLSNANRPPTHHPTKAAFKRHYPARLTERNNFNCRTLKPRRRFPFPSLQFQLHIWVLLQEPIIFRTALCEIVMVLRRQMLGMMCKSTVRSTV
jgi:hypothetical protein